MTDRKTLIEGFHKGTGRTEAEAIAYSNRFMMHWSDIQSTATSFTEHEAEARELVHASLGYQPEPLIYLPHAGFIRTLIESFRRQCISEETFYEDLVRHVKNIRNDDMDKHGWSHTMTYDVKDFERYEKTLGIYQSGVRERLSRLLGYIPLPDYSLDAEIYLRQLFQFNWFHDNLPFCDLDFRAATICRYREALLTLGVKAANESSLAGIVYAGK